MYQSGFHSACNDFNINVRLQKPSETVPATKKVSRVGSNSESHSDSLISKDTPIEDDHSLGFNFRQQHQNELIIAQANQTRNGGLSNTGFEPSTLTEQGGILRLEQQIGSRNNIQQLLNQSKLSERRQEFSATFNNQLSSVKKENEDSSGESKSAGAIIPNFYPKQQLPDDSQLNDNTDIEKDYNPDLLRDCGEDPSFPNSSQQQQQTESSAIPLVRAVKKKKVPKDPTTSKG